MGLSWEGERDFKADSVHVQRDNRIARNCDIARQEERKGEMTERGQDT